MSRKRVVIVHGYRGRPDLGWLKWLADELTAREIEVINPKLLHASHPNLDEWIAQLTAAVGALDGQTVFVSHSMGVPTVLRFLNEYPGEPQLAGAVFVAGFYEPAGGKHSDFFGAEPNFGRLQRMIKQRYVIHSDNDTSVKPAQSQELARALDAQDIIIPGRGHFANNDPTPINEALESVLKSLE